MTKHLSTRQYVVEMVAKESIYWAAVWRGRINSEFPRAFRRGLRQKGVRLFGEVIKFGGFREKDDRNLD